MFKAFGLSKGPRADISLPSDPLFVLEDVEEDANARTFDRAGAASAPEALYDPAHGKRSKEYEGHNDEDDDTDSIDETVLHRDEIEKESRFLEDGQLETGYGNSTAAHQIGRRGRARPQRHSRTFLLVLVSIVLSACLIGALSASGFKAPVYGGTTGGNRHITLDHVFNGTFSPKVARVDWVKEAGDGVYSTRTAEGNIVLEDIGKNRSQTVLVEASDVRDHEGNQIVFQEWKLSADMQYVMLKTDYRKLWRHSSFGNYYIHRLSDHSTFPLAPVTKPALISHVVWSPVSHNVAFVRENDIYVVAASTIDAKEGNQRNSPKAERVTFDGSDVILNGVNSWVYEEEVLQAPSAMWWNPAGDSIAFMRQNESAVPEYTIHYYNPSKAADEPHPYPSNLVMRYPTPGYPNPLVTIWVHRMAGSSAREVKSSLSRLTWDESITAENQVIISVDWVDEYDLLVKETDRASKHGNVVLFRKNSRAGQVVRRLGQDGEQGDEGWIDHSTEIAVLKGNLPGYLDIVPNSDGYNHLALFSPADASKPIWITEGDWEVAGGISAVNADADLVYFVAAKPSTERHVFSAKLPSSISELADFSPSIEPLTDIDRPGYYDASFSPSAGYYALRYQGPEVPWQKMMRTQTNDLEYILEDNAALNATTAEFCKPLVSYETVDSDGYELNVVELLPPNFDASGHRKKYPVIFNPYGGPGSQSADTRFKRDWHHYLACEKKYIVVTVDGRGTGFKGRNLRNPIRDQVGVYEARDQINVAREWAKKRYVDQHRIGIWGWSFGGFLTSKVLEMNSGIFSLGMAVAPVTNWLYYDSIYTERYMSTPSENPEGYDSTAIHNVTSFDYPSTGVSFFLAHGTGDDNVHFANTAYLVDELTQAGVEGWKMRMFTDSDHSISLRGAYRALFDEMTRFLDERWGKSGSFKQAHVMA